MTPADTIKAYYGLFEKASREVLDRVVTDDFRLDDNPINWRLRGKDDLWRTVNRPRPTPQPGVEQGSFTCHEYYGDDRAGAIHWLWRVPGPTLAAFGLPPGKGMAEVHGLALCTFRDGKLSSLTEYWDLANLLRQLGVSVPEARMPAAQPAS